MFRSLIYKRGNPEDRRRATIFIIFRCCSVNAKLTLLPSISSVHVCVLRVPRNRSSLSGNARDSMARKFNELFRFAEYGTWRVRKQATGWSLDPAAFIIAGSAGFVADERCKKQSRRKQSYYSYVRASFLTLWRVNRGRICRAARMVVSLACACRHHEDSLDDVRKSPTTRPRHLSRHSRESRYVDA